MKSTQGSSRLQDSTDQLKAVLRKRHGDQGGSGVAGGEESGGGPNSPTAALQRNSVAGEDRGRGQRLGKLPGLEAELLCGSGGAGVRRSGVATAAQRLCSVGKTGRGRWGCGGGYGVAW